MFPSDDATLSTDDLDALSHVSRILLGVGITRLAVEGHTDNLGGDEHNRVLSERRARVVADALVARGFAMIDITMRAFGASRPIADNATELGRLHNRRAALIVPSI